MIKYEDKIFISHSIAAATEKSAAEFSAVVKYESKLIPFCLRDESHIFIRIVAKAALPCVYFVKDIGVTGFGILYRGARYFVIGISSYLLILICLPSSICALM